MTTIFNPLDLHQGRISRKEYFTGQMKFLSKLEDINLWHAVMTTYIKEFFMFMAELSREGNNVENSDKKNFVDDYITQASFLHKWHNLSPIVKQQVSIYVCTTYADAIKYVTTVRCHADAIGQKDQIIILKESAGKSPLYGLSRVVDETTKFIRELPLYDDVTQKSIRSYLSAGIGQLWEFALNEYLSHNTVHVYNMGFVLSFNDQQILFQDIADTYNIAPSFVMFQPLLLRKEVNFLMNLSDMTNILNGTTNVNHLSFDQQQILKSCLSRSPIPRCTQQDCKDVDCGKILVQKAVSFIVKHNIQVDEKDHRLLQIYFQKIKDPVEGGSTHHEVIRYFVSRKAYSPQCAEALMSIKKHDSRDKNPIFNHEDLCTNTFKHNMTFLVGKYYQCMDENAISLIKPVLAYNIKEHSRTLAFKMHKEKSAAQTCIVNYFSGHMKRVDFARENNIPEVLFVQLSLYQRKIIMSYLSSYFFVSTLHCSRDEDAKIILNPDEIRGMFRSKVTALHAQLQQGDDAFLATVAIMLMHIYFMDAHFYHENMPKYVHENLDQNSLRNLLNCYKIYDINIKRKTTIELDYQKLPQSLYSGLHGYKLSINASDIRVHYYNMIEGVKVAHAGVDAKGLLRHCIQANIDQLMKKSYVKRDEDKKIYFDWTEINSLHREQRPYNIVDQAHQLAALFVLIITTGEAVDLPIKEEILREFFLEEAKNTTIGMQLVLSTSYEECLQKSITMLKEGKMNQKEYEENIKMICGEHNKTYIGDANFFIYIAKKTIRRQVAHCRHMLYFQRFKSLFYQNVILDPSVIAEKIVLHSWSYNVQVREATAKVKKLRQIVKAMNESQIKKFIALAIGKVGNVEVINVVVKDVSMLPTWSSCSSKMEIGADFCEERLMYAMDNVDGFHLI